MSSTSLKKRTSLGGGGNAVSSRASAGGGLVAAALGFGGSVPDEVTRKVNKIDFFSLSLRRCSLFSPLTFSLRSFSMQRPPDFRKKKQEAERRERSRQSRRRGETR